MGRFNILQQFKALGQIAKSNLMPNKQAAVLGSPTRIGEQPPAPPPIQPAPPVAVNQATPLARPVQPQFDVSGIQTQLANLQKTAEGLQGQVAGFQPPAPAPAPVPAPAPASDTGLKTAEEALLKAQQITPEEVQAQQQLNELIASARLGLTDIQGKPIALPFITGQQAALERRAGALAEPLTSRLALLQAQREAGFKGAETKLGIEKERFARAKPDETEVSEFVNENGERVVVFKNKTTGQLRKEIIGKEKKGVKAFELSAGQKRYEFNPITGKYEVVASVAPKAEKPTKESIVDVRQRKQDLADLLGQVASYENREEALSELDKYQGSILEKVRDEGMNKLKAEVDRLFPEEKEKKEAAGETTGLFDSFFKRLFGR